MDREQLRDFVAQAQTMIDAGAVEDRIRHFLSSRLDRIFPDYPWWVQAHMQGTEERVHFATQRGNRGGFVDAVVGKTAIEYEKNLTNHRIFSEGFHQVREYSAALCNLGIPENEVLGVLSDTIRWYGYRVRIVRDTPKEQLFGPEDVELKQVSFVDLSAGTDEEFTRFEHFINQFMAREEARFLTANTLAADFGVDSSFYREYIGVFSNLVQRAMTEKPDYAELIKQVWQNFIAYLGASDYGAFSTQTYVSEYYLVTVAKILCANILAGKALVSADGEIKAILGGDYFSRQNIYNFVDYDYFGWLNDTPYVDGIVPCVRELQNRLRAYDFSRIGEQDIFGHLLAQLANREHRLMLGQEFTPHWIARDIVQYNMKKLGDEIPRIMDMCCGSGVFLIEVITAVREKYKITPDNYDVRKDDIIFNAIIGFDIDPLAVMLAKVNWIMAMSDLFVVHEGSITVPIYHADSLFVATPITHRMPAQGEDYYVLTLNQQPIRIPAYLFSPAYRRVFDSFISKVYRLAMARANAPGANDTVTTATLLDAVMRESGIDIEEERKTEIEGAAAQLVTQLESLQRQGKNGIWHFIICNSYRPGLIKSQFNCIVSNPPWMAMSKLADNPYKNSLRDIARKYAIQPSGAAHPHMELATIFLVSSIDRYLKEGAHWSCIVPASLLSGLNHEPFRGECYRSSSAHLEAKVSAIWELPAMTFKNKAVVLSGEKSNIIPASIDGRVYETDIEYTNCTYTLNHQGSRSAWTNRGIDVDVADVIAADSIHFAEGCDLFPRTVFFHEYTKRPDGNWDIAPIKRTGNLWYLISGLKKDLCNNMVAVNIDREYIYDAYISKHLSPFIMSDPAKTIIPGKKQQGTWTALNDDDLALMNGSTASVFREIADAVENEIGPFFEKKVDIRRKLSNQDFATRDYLVLSSAGGSNPCAAYINLNEYDRSQLVIDQTLYWYLAATEDEAIYITGLINSPALWEAISDFQPEGGFGRRHIHTLPYKIIPAFNLENDSHIEVIKATKALMEEWNTICESESYRKLLDPNSGELPYRRRRQQAKMKELEAYERYVTACAEALG